MNLDVQKTLQLRMSMNKSNTQYTLAVSAFADVVCSANNNVIISETDSIKEFNFEGVSSQGRKCD